MRAELKNVADHGDRRVPFFRRERPLLDWRLILTKNNLIDLVQREAGNLNGGIHQDELFELDFQSIEIPFALFVDGGLNPRLSGAALKTGTNFAANSWRPECGAMDPCQRRKPPEAVAKGQRLQGSVAR